MADVIAPTRNELAKFLPNQRLIIAFENLFKEAQEGGDDEEIALTAGTADAKATQALASLQTIANALDLLSKEPQREQSHSLDYIDFNNNPRNALKPNRAFWNNTDDTLRLVHEKGTLQDVGQDLYYRVINNTGATLTKGTFVGYAGATGGELEIEKYIADGTLSPLFPLGILTQDLADGERGESIRFGKIGGLNTSSFSVGNILYASATTAGELTETRPTAPDYVVVVGVVLSTSVTDGEVVVRVSNFEDSKYGTFYDTTDQTPAAINTAYPITFDSTQSSNGVTIGTPSSRIVIEEAGLYNVSFSVQITSNSSSAKNLWFFPRVNGIDVAGSSMKQSIVNNTTTVALSRTMTFNFNAGDYIEAVYASDDTDVTLEAVPSTAFAPSTPSVIISVRQIAK